MQISLFLTRLTGSMVRVNGKLQSGVNKSLNLRLGRLHISVSRNHIRFLDIGAG